MESAYVGNAGGYPFGREVGKLGATSFQCKSFLIIHVESSILQRRKMLENDLCVVAESVGGNVINSTSNVIYCQFKTPQSSSAVLVLAWCTWQWMAGISLSNAVQCGCWPAKREFPFLGHSHHSNICCSFSSFKYVTLERRFRHICCRQICLLLLLMVVAEYKPLGCFIFLGCMWQWHIALQVVGYQHKVENVVVLKINPVMGTRHSLN